MDPSVKFKVDNDLLESFYLSWMNPEKPFKNHNFFVQCLGAIDLLWHHEWQRSDFEPFPNIFQWQPLIHLHMGGDSVKYSETGKYIVRLFHSNAWRSISVDDQMPLVGDDELGWPSVLLKAIWKVNFPKVQKEASVSSESLIVKCPCSREFERKLLPPPRSYLDPIQLLLGWNGAKYSLKFLSKCQKWSTVASIINFAQNHELIVLEVEVDGVKRYYDAVDIRYFPQIEFPRKELSVLHLFFLYFCLNYPYQL